MDILCICKASINEGLGHLLRAMTFCNRLKGARPEVNLNLILISDLNLSHLLDGKDLSFQVYKTFPAEKHLEKKYDLIFVDLLTLKSDEIHLLKQRSNSVVSLSPIFNHMAECDALITRTKYLGDPTTSLPPKVISGLDYAIIRENVHKISPEKYRLNLERQSLHVGISLGGTDPHNNTLNVIKNLKTIDSPVVFWVLLGEGYKYQYDELVAEIKGHKNHEMILARTNKNMWQVLENCNLAILAGGLTSYEAAYAGLPAINYFSDPSKSFLIRELEENNLSLKSCYALDNLHLLLEEYLAKTENLVDINKAAQDYHPMENNVLNQTLDQLT